MASFVNWYFTRLYTERGKTSKGEFLPNNIHHHGRGIVTARGCDDLVDKDRGGFPRGGAQDVLDAAGVEETVGDDIRAVQESVAGLEAHGANLGLDLLRFCAEDFLQDISLGVVFRLALIDLAVSKKPADIGIVVGDLFHDAALVVARAEIEKRASRPGEDAVENLPRSEGLV
jgi:hypothetical protein